VEAGRTSRLPYAIARFNALENAGIEYRGISSNVLIKINLDA
jgi:hypothetical protein